MRHPLHRFRVRFRFRPRGRIPSRALPDPSTHPIARAVATGRYSDEQAAAARRGLGRPTESVSAEALLGAAESLVLSTDGQSAAEVLRSARNLRAVIEADAIAVPPASAGTSTSANSASGGRVDGGVDLVATEPGRVGSHS